jgi:hypothetical protein
MTLAGEVLVSGSIITLSFPEYIVDSVFQSLDPITDDFLIAIAPGMDKAEYPASLGNGFYTYAGIFWKLGAPETPSSFALTPLGQVTEVPYKFRLIYYGKSPESNLAYAFTTLGP